MERETRNEGWISCNVTSRVYKETMTGSLSETNANYILAKANPICVQTFQVRASSLNHQEPSLLNSNTYIANGK